MNSNSTSNHLIQRNKLTPLGYIWHNGINTNSVDLDTIDPWLLLTWVDPDYTLNITSAVEASVLNAFYRIESAMHRLAAEYNKPIQSYVRLVGRPTNDNYLQLIVNWVPPCTEKDSE